MVTAELVQLTFENVAIRADDAAVRTAAWKRLAGHAERTDQRLATVAIQSTDPDAGAALVPLIERRAKLKEVAGKAKVEAVRRAAADLIAQRDAEQSGPSDEQRRRERAAGLAACVERAAF